LQDIAGSDGSSLRRTSFGVCLLSHIAGNRTVLVPFCTLLYIGGGGGVHYSRGKITVVNRPGLEARVCECYQVVKKEFDRLLPEINVH
jgi:hypothetical protein